jgi:hypothetical protein
MDQRGVIRTRDGAGCDIGAYELDDADLAVSVTAPATVTPGSMMV